MERTTVFVDLGLTRQMIAAGTPVMEGIVVVVGIILVKRARATVIATPTVRMV